MIPHFLDTMITLKIWIIMQLNNFIYHVLLNWCRNIHDFNTENEISYTQILQETQPEG